MNWPASRPKSRKPKSRITWMPWPSPACSLTRNRMIEWCALSSTRQTGPTGSKKCRSTSPRSRSRLTMTGVPTLTATSQTSTSKSTTTSMAALSPPPVNANYASSSLSHPVKAKAGSLPPSSLSSTTPRQAVHHLLLVKAPQFR